MVWNYRMRECVALWGLFRLRPPPPLFFNTSRARTQSLIRPLLIGKYTLGAVVRCRVALLRNNLLFITLNNSRLWARTLKAPCKKVLFFASRSRAHAAIVIKYNVCAGHVALVTHFALARSLATRGYAKLTWTWVCRGEISEHDWQGG